MHKDKDMGDIIVMVEDIVTGDRGVIPLDLALVLLHSMDMDMVVDIVAVVVCSNILLHMQHQHHTMEENIPLTV